MDKKDKEDSEFNGSIAFLFWKFYWSAIKRVLDFFSKTSRSCSSADEEEDDEDDDDLDPTEKDRKEKERRQANNARERFEGLITWIQNFQLTNALIFATE